ncbi:hypothetical protein Hanom_Chr00s000001g01596101 [Helianthus anomalus]
MFILRLENHQEPTASRQQNIVGLKIGKRGNLQPICVDFTRFMIEHLNQNQEECSFS